MADKMTVLQRNIGIMLDFFRPFPNVRFTLVGGNTRCSEPSIVVNFNYPNVRRFNRCVGSNDAIAALNEALIAPPFSPNARIEAVIISDGNGVGIGNMSFDFNYRSSAIVSSIVGIGQVSNPALYCFFPTSTVVTTVCSWEAVGYQFMTLSQHTTGRVYNICNPNWTPLLLDLFNRL